LHILSAAVTFVALCHLVVLLVDSVGRTCSSYGWQHTEGFQWQADPCRCKQYQRREISGV